MSNEWHIGRKAIILFLRPYIGLSNDHDVAWNMVRRWRKHQGLGDIIRSQPNGRPYIDEAEFEMWWQKFLERSSGFKGGS